MAYLMFQNANYSFCFYVFLDERVFVFNKLNDRTCMYPCFRACVHSHCSEHPWRLRSETFVPSKKSIFAQTPKHDEEAEQQTQCAVDDNDDDDDDDDDDRADDDGDDAVDLSMTMTDDNDDIQLCESLDVQAAVCTHSCASCNDNDSVCSNDTPHER